MVLFKYSKAKYVHNRFHIEFSLARRA